MKDIIPNKDWEILKEAQLFQAEREEKNTITEIDIDADEKTVNKIASRSTTNSNNSKNTRKKQKKYGIASKSQTNRYNQIINN